MSEASEALDNGLCRALERRCYLGPEDQLRLAPAPWNYLLLLGVEFHEYGTSAQLPRPSDVPNVSSNQARSDGPFQSLTA